MDGAPTTARGQGYGGREDRSFDDSREFEARRSGPTATGCSARARPAPATTARRSRPLPGLPRRPSTTAPPARDRPAWQERDYAGVSPAMEQGEYELENRRIARGRDPRFGAQDYTAQD